MKVIDLDRDAIKKGLAEGTLLVIDVREPHEYEAGDQPEREAALNQKAGEPLAHVGFPCALRRRSSEPVAWCVTAQLRGRGRPEPDENGGDRNGPPDAPEPRLRITRWAHRTHTNP